MHIRRTIFSTIRKHNLFGHILITKSWFTIPLPNNTLSDNLENMDIQGEIIDQEDNINSSPLPNDLDMDKDEDTDYRSSITKMNTMTSYKGCMIECLTR